MQNRAAVSIGEAQTIETLRERHKSLEQKRIVAETNRSNAEKRLSELKDEAKTLFGTDDLGKLGEMLAAMVAENERKRAEYQQTLDEIEGDLSAVEAKYKEALEVS